MKKNLSPIDNKGRLPEYISIISASQCARIRIDDIECIEQEGRKLHILVHNIGTGAVHADYWFNAR